MRSRTRCYADSNNSDKGTYSSNMTATPDAIALIEGTWAAMILYARDKIGWVFKIRAEHRSVCGNA